MARAAGARGGYYISHIRDEADLSLDAIREAIAVGERAKLPVQITHIKLGTVGVWGKANEVVALVEAAQKRGVDVTADAYPYLAWQSTPRVLVPNKQYDDPASVKRGARRHRRREERPDHALGRLPAVRRQAARRDGPGRGPHRRRSLRALRPGRRRRDDRPRHDRGRPARSSTSSPG